MSEQTNEIYYRLARSALTVVGSIESYVNTETGEPDGDTKADVALINQTDPRPGARRRLPADRPAEIAVTLTEDGRLSSVSGSTKGVVPQLVEAGASVLGFAAGLVGKALPLLGVPAIGAAAEGKPTPVERWQEQNRDDACRLSRAVVALKELHDAIVTTSRKTAQEDGQPAAQYRRLVALKAAVAVTEEEIAAIKTRRDAWLAKEYPTQTTRHTFVVATDDVFALESNDPAPPQQISASALGKAPPVAHAVLDTLGIALVEFVYRGEAALPSGDPGERVFSDDEDELRKQQDLEHGELPLGIEFRVPRPSTLAIYRASPNEGNGAERTFQLERVDRLWVVDERSRLGYLDLQSGRSDSVKGSVSFSPAGMPTAVATAETSAIGDFAQALGKVPERLAAGMKEAKGLAESWDALYTTRKERQANQAQREIDALERRKKALEAEIAVRGLEASGKEQVTLEELKDRLERLKAEKEIQGFTEGAPPTEAQARFAERKDLLEELRVDVAIARAEAALAAFDDRDREPVA